MVSYEKFGLNHTKYLGFLASVTTKSGLIKDERDLHVESDIVTASC